MLKVNKKGTIMTSVMPVTLNTSATLNRSHTFFYISLIYYAYRNIFWEIIVVRQSLKLAILVNVQFTIISNPLAMR